MIDKMPDIRDLPIMTSVVGRRRRVQSGHPPSVARWHLVDCDRARHVGFPEAGSRGRENSAEFGREFDLSLKDIKLFYNKYLVWLAGSPKPTRLSLQFGESRVILPNCRDSAVLSQQKALASQWVGWISP